MIIYSYSEAQKLSPFDIESPQASIKSDILRERLISFEELWEMLAMESDGEKRLFLQWEQVLHAGGLLNLYGTCAD